MTDDDVANPCAECGGKCCSFATLRISFGPIEPTESFEDLIADRDRWVEQLVFDDGTVPDMDWYVIQWPSGRRALAFDCNHLDGGLCGEYDRRPAMCRTFECEALDEDDDATLDDVVDRYGHDVDDPIDEYAVEDVTDRVQEILKARSEASGWGD